MGAQGKESDAMDREEEFEPVHSERVVAVCDVQYCQCKGLTDVCAFCTYS